MGKRLAADSSNVNGRLDVRTSVHLQGTTNRTKCARNRRQSAWPDGKLDPIEYVYTLSMQTEPGLFETTRCPCLASRRAARAITGEFDEALRAHGQRATQVTLLAALHLAWPRSIGELAELLSADRTTLTRNLAVAEQHGWLTTRSSRNGARARSAAITPAGSDVLKKALTVWREVQQGLRRGNRPRPAESLRRLAGGRCTRPEPPAPSEGAHP